MISFSDDGGDLVAALGESLEIDPADVLAAMSAIGAELENWLRSLTSEMRPPPGARMVTYAGGTTKLYVPPRYRGEGEREAHPGHWADVTGQLALSYDSKAWQSGAAVWVLEISNNAEYAEALENLEGYWVLDGVLSTGQAEALMAQYLTPLLPSA